MSIPPLAAATFWIALILGMTAGFFVMVRKWSARRQRGDFRSANELMAEFRDLHARGGLSDEEYGRIRENLTPRLRRELSEGAGAETMNDAADALKETARSLLAGWGGAEGERDERDANGAAGGAAQRDCDATPPAGGDSTEERR